MLWSYVQLDDGTQFAYSETRDDGTVHVAVERPVDFGFDHAECFLPAVKWFNVEGFSTDDLDFLTEFVRSNAPLIFELAERQKNRAGGGIMPRNDCLGSVRLARYVPRHFCAISGSVGKTEIRRAQPVFLQQNRRS